MTEISQRTIDKLVEVSKLIADILATVQGTKPQLLPEVKAIVEELVARGFCLHGDHEIGPDDKPSRGMCKTHYNHWKYRCDNEEGLSEELLIARGLWTRDRLTGKPKIAPLKPRKNRFPGMTSRQLIKRREILTAHLYQDESQWPVHATMPNAAQTSDDAARVVDAVVNEKTKPKKEA